MIRYNAQAIPMSRSLSQSFIALFLTSRMVSGTGKMKIQPRIHRKVFLLGFGAGVTGAVGVL